MSVYCCSIWGVRRRAIHGARTDWKGRGMRSPSEKRFLRKSWVSGTCGRGLREVETSQASVRTVDGPPMFSMTIASALDESIFRRIATLPPHTCRTTDDVNMFLWIL